MSNLIKHRQFKNGSYKKALLRNLTIALVEHGSIKTTRVKAKEMRPYVEKLITLSKKGADFNTVRKLKSILNNKEAVKKLVDVIGPMNAARPGGYTRIYNIANRAGDNAPMSVIQFVEQSSAE